MSVPRLVGLTLGESPDAWRRAGFAVDNGGAFIVGTLVFGACVQGRGVQGGGVQDWTLLNTTGSGDIDGLATKRVEPIGSPPRQSHPNGVTSLDHLVIGSPNRERTVEVFSDRLGLEPRRETTHRLYGRDMVQTFYLLPPTLIEVISRPDESGQGPSVFWGLAFVVDDLDATVASLGERCSPPKDAVQPGRRIATLDHEAAGLATPVAFMTPRPPRR